MLTGRKSTIIRECERINAARRVYYARIDHNSFFQQTKGDLLISGYNTENPDMTADLVCNYIKRGDIPAVVLSPHPELFKILKNRQEKGEINGIKISCPAEKNYHPFYGMSEQQLLYFLQKTAGDLGCHEAISKLLIYAAAVLNVVTTSYPLSLPALIKLLQKDDDFISGLALQKGLSNVTADNIRANTEAGIILRRVCERLENIFEDVYTGECDTKYNLLTGVQENTPAMIFYTTASNQEIMNSYLKEELFSALKRVSKIRVIVDEIAFMDKNDELLKYLFQMKRQGRIELIIISRNVKETVYDMELNFANIIMFQHDDLKATEDLSRTLFGEYTYAYPVSRVENTPGVFFSFKSSLGWAIATEERLRVRADDLESNTGLLFRKSDLLAVKTAANKNIYLVETSLFLLGNNGNTLPLRKI